MPPMVVFSKEQVKERFAKRLNEALDRVAGAPQRGRPQWLRLRYNKAISQEAARKWLAGETLPDQAHLSMICTDLKIRVDWLYTGHGPMLIEDECQCWPFSFDQGRFARLTRGQRIAAEGALLGAVVDFEAGPEQKKPTAA